MNRHHAGAQPSRWSPVAWVVLAASLLVLNASLTFHNIWPTPAVGWAGEVSFELAVFVIALWGWTAMGRTVSPRGRRTLAAVWLVLAIGRYAHVTAPALWGRELNFYWDLRFVPDVASMLARAAGTWTSMAAIAAVGGVLAAASFVLTRALDIVVHAARVRAPRRAMGAIAAGLMAAYPLRPAPVAQAPPAAFTFPTPVTETYARQVTFTLRALRGTTRLPPSPAFDVDLAHARGADVMLLFVESYGAVVFERPEFAGRLAGPKAAFEAAIGEAGLTVVSALVESPTFGGSSWFAHITLLSGIDVRDPDANAILMTEQRDTMAKAFARLGYRTVAALPGIWHPWPEGVFYGFQQIYNGPGLGYEGPPFGWWSLPDQFTLAKLDALEVNRSGRPPLFVFFPTISTHAPFVPTPPYQPDWARMLTEHPYEREDRDRAYAMQPDWTNLAPSYLGTVAYAYETFGGYLRQHAGRDVVIVMLGDHQPPALVSGEGTPWDVPVHIITSRQAILDRLRARGFTSGLTPTRPSLGPMSQLTPVLMDALSSAK